MATNTNRLYTAAKAALEGDTLDVSNLGIAILDQDAIFDPLHADYNNAGVVLKTQDITGTAQNSVLDIDDFSVIGITVNLFIGACILYNKNNNEPYVYFADVSGLPHRSTGSSVFFSFSNGPNKLVKVTGGVEVFPPIFFTIGDASFTAANETVVRPVTNLPKAQKKIVERPAVYKDLTIKGVAHPLTGDVSRVFDLDAIVQSMKNILLIDFNELPFGNTIGGNINALNFNNFDARAIDEIQERVFTALDNIEPRATVEDVSVEFDESNRAVQITVKFFVNGLTDTEEFTLFLERI